MNYTNNKDTPGFYANWLTVFVLLWDRPNRQHYVSCPSVRPSVCPSVSVSRICS